jgi:NitT/TauT family transport system substrate-binding protein
MRQFKSHAVAGLALASLLSLAACGGDSGADSGTADGTVTMAIQGSSRSNVPFLIADQEGFFKDHGINFETVPIEGGGGPVVAAVASGSVDVILQAPNVVGSANQQGQDLRYFCGNSSLHSWTILSQPGSGITAFEDSGDWVEVVKSLEGKTVGIPGRGASLEASLYGLIDEAGVDREAIEFRAIGFGDPARVAFEAGQVDAMIGYPFLSSQMVRSGKAELALDLASNGPESFRDLFVDGFAASAKWLEGNPEVAEDFCAALADSEAYIADAANHDALAQLLRSDFALEDEQVIEDAIAGLSILKAELPEQNITAAIDFAVATGQIQSDPPVTFDNLVSAVPSAR